MAQQLGGQVSAGLKREFGYAQVEHAEPSALFKGIEDHVLANGKGVLDVWMSHGDQVTTLPPAFKCIASTNNCKLAAIADESRHFYGIQFHPEVSHTRQGLRIIERFLCDICGCEPTWTSKNIIEEQVEQIRKQVGLIKFY